MSGSQEFCAERDGQHIVALRWPAEAAEARRVAALGIPRLLLVQAGADPPVVGDTLQAWIRLPTDGGELEAHLTSMVTQARIPDGPIRIDANNRLFAGERWVALTKTEARVAAAFVANFGEVVTNERLLKAGWPDRSAPPSNVRVQVHRLRERLRPLGLELQTIRGQGIILRRQR